MMRLRLGEGLRVRVLVEVHGRTVEGLGELWWLRLL